MGYNLKIVYSGENKIEIYFSGEYTTPTGMIRNPNGKNGKSELSEDEKKENSINNRVQYLTRIRNNIVRISETNADKFKSFITLTYNKDVTEEENTKYLNLFFTKLRRTHKELSYLWVLERTKKGRIHVHLLTSIEFPKCTAKSNERKTNDHKKVENELEKIWSYKKKNLGWVDIRAIPTHDDKRRSALYLAAYINKSYDCTKIEKQKHLWGYSSKTLNKPYEEKIEVIGDIGDILKMYAKGYKVTYLSNYPIVINGEVVGEKTYIDLYRRDDTD